LIQNGADVDEIAIFPFRTPLDSYYFWNEFELDDMDSLSRRRACRRLLLGAGADPTLESGISGGNLERFRPISNALADGCFVSSIQLSLYGIIANSCVGIGADNLRLRWSIYRCEHEG
jgi:hypothetical protein